MKELYKDLPSWAKGVVVVGGIAIIYFTTKSIIKSVANASKMQDAKREADEAKDELYRLAQQGIRPTLSQSQLEGMCQELISAFDGCGTDEGAVKRVFQKIKNDADVLSLIATYGARSYDDCNITEGLGNTTSSLSKALTNEMNSSDVKTNVNDVLQQRGVKYRF
jgi:hypothetical protein